MQTFLPFPSFYHTASVLDMKRLGKQRVECLQILMTLRGFSDGWKNHPAVRMWTGYENVLVEYGFIICKEWISRGYRDACLHKITSLGFSDRPLEMPFWMGNEEFHLSHRVALFNKDPIWYGKFWQPSPEELRMPYVWPNSEPFTPCNERR